MGSDRVYLRSEQGLQLLRELVDDRNRALQRVELLQIEVETLRLRLGHVIRALRTEQDRPRG